MQRKMHPRRAWPASEGFKILKESPGRASESFKKIRPDRKRGDFPLGSCFKTTPRSREIDRKSLRDLRTRHQKPQKCDFRDNFETDFLRQLFFVPPFSERLPPPHVKISRYLESYAYFQLHAYFNGIPGALWTQQLSNSATQHLSFSATRHLSFSASQI